MASQKVYSTLLSGCVAVTSWTIFLRAVPTRAQSSPANYAFLVASGFLCDPTESATCPAVVKSAQGDRYEISGAGTLTTQSKSVTAAGVFTHKSRDGNALETGIWVASELVSFDSYGIAPGALMRAGRGLGGPAFGPMRSRMLAGSIPAGGLAVFRIRLLPMWGVSRTAILQVNCALGKVPEEHPTEGIRLAFEGGGIAFDEEVSGRTLFVLTRPAASPAPTSPAPPDGTNPVPAEAHP